MYKLVFPIILLSVVIAIGFGWLSKNRIKNSTDTKNNKIQITCDFDHGSIGSLKQVSENKFRGQPMHWIKKDGIGNMYYWFYFRITNVKNRELTFEFDNLTGIYRGDPIDHYIAYTQPVVSYNNEQWQRIANVEYDDDKKQFLFSHQFLRDTAWIAYAHPYSYKRSIHFEESVSTNPYVKSCEIGKSPEGRSINLFEISNHQVQHSDKKNILIISLQHGGEDCGGFFSEGLISFLVSNAPDAKNIRDKFTFYVIPLLNPDGLYHGVTRYNINMEDLNTEWDDDISDKGNLPVEPEVLAVKKWVKNLYESGANIDLLIDVHGQSQKWTNNAFWDKSGNLAELVKINAKGWVVKHFVSKSKESNSASSFFYNQYNVPSATLELTQSYTGDFNYVDISDYHFYGKTFVRSVSEFYSGLSNPTIKKQDK